ncbi:conserved protein of unknown function [Pseudomonas sp. JV551A1]|uniref:Uncharacterized protein n=1 Tax=Pseudomonas inefficax TaxID=2078786 RepID=A0AAQ1PE29_9PSED|nr:hypothetical protein [Pseudomonas]SPO57818.1 conserved protein of unknown function [Pseudomonas sp. JV551A1]SPO63942.1 conserved protein of unknown function [Pseudomonas inefficax]
MNKEIEVNGITIFAKEEYEGEIWTNLYQPNGPLQSCVVRDMNVIDALHTAKSALQPGKPLKVYATITTSGHPILLEKVRIGNFSE